MKLRTTKLKPKLDPHQYITKKQRTKRPRRIRWQISPILISRLRSAPPQKSQGFHAFSVNSSPSLYFGDELSCDSSRVTFKSSATKRKLRETEGIEKIEDDPFRRITRSYYKQKENERKENEVEVSESSCVESKSRVDCVAPGKRRSSKLKKRAEDSKEIQISEGSTSVTKSEISSLHQNLSFNGKSLENISSEGKDNDTFSIVSGVESCLSHGTIERVKRTETELSEISKHDAFSIDESVVEQKPKSLGAVEADLACAERISYDDVVTEYSSSHETAFSELQSEVFLGSSSDIEFSDYTPSIFFDSGSEFSEKSVDDSPPSQTYSLLLEFRQKFSRSSVPLDMIRCPFTEAEYLLHSSFVKFEIQDDEESYQRFRERERRQLFLHDYVELYCSTTEYGSLILEQRLQMVHWIVEQSTAKEFQLETTFLGVSLLDRFLSKGFFKNKRSLQIVGIACLTLATRIEENQPYNSVRQKNFPMESSAYSRFEVVAMEWLVQEVLNFQCFLPTIHNFMWFYLKAARADAKVEKKARYLAKLALSDHEHLRYWPSTVAAGLVILASLESDQIESYQRVIEVHVRTKENDLRECMKVPILPGNVYAINDALSAEGAAEDYETCLKHLVNTKVIETSSASGFPKLDLMLLGMGPDGHVASLFPGHHLCNENKKWVTFIKDSPKPPPERITFTFPVINSAAYIALVVCGAGKADAVQKALGKDQNTDVLPVQMVSAEGEFKWFLDKDAASKL